MIQFEPGLEIRVHMKHDPEIPEDKEKARLIAEHLRPHIRARASEYEVLFDKFMELSLKELQDVFNKAGNSADNR